ncbi:hypothetical protein [Sinorhizobium alkalisoli]|nr:hypothetical protein [Sinorhizobium alkalisoli]QFI70470.1 hypothetical protein EKH55_5596 [Sinorhizobium alkalisoli]
MSLDLENFVSRIVRNVAIPIDIPPAQTRNLADTEAKPEQQAEDGGVGGTAKRGVILIREFGGALDELLSSPKIQDAGGSRIASAARLHRDRRAIDDVMFDHPLEQAADDTDKMVEASRTGLADGSGKKASRSTGVIWVMLVTPRAFR